MGKRYYFITYQATAKCGTITTCNEVTNKSPMDFIKYVESIEETDKHGYKDFVVINVFEISEKDYINYKDRF